MDIVVAYDVDTTTRAGQRRLAQVARVCEGYGVRVQYSVFECRLSPTSVARFLLELRAVIDASKDRVHVYRFEGPIADARTSLGRPPAHEWGRPWVVAPPRTPGDPGADPSYE
jgi:CRISPR-associated protein Cas2